MNYYTQLDSKDKQMIQNALICRVRALLNDKKDLLTKYHKLPKYKRKFYNKRDFQWYSVQSSYLNKLATYMDFQKYKPDAKALTNMWICLKRVKSSFKSVYHYDATKALNLIMKQMKIFDLTTSNHESKNEKIENSSEHNNMKNNNVSTNTNVNTNSILSFIKNHLNHLNSNQIMRGVYKWSKQTYSNATYFNKLLPNKVNVLSMTYIKQSCQKAINKTLKRNQLDESVKITKTLSQIKQLHSKYFVLNHDKLLPLDKSLCDKIVNELSSNHK